MTQTQFIVQMIVATKRLFPTLDTDAVMRRAAQTFKEFLADNRIEFGDPRYVWTADGAAEIVAKFSTAKL